MHLNEASRQSIARVHLVTDNLLPSLYYTHTHTLLDSQLQPTLHAPYASTHLPPFPTIISGTGSMHIFLRSLSSTWHDCNKYTRHQIREWRIICLLEFCVLQHGRNMCLLPMFCIVSCLSVCLCGIRQRFFVLTSPK